MTTKLSILFLGLCVALFAQSPPQDPQPNPSQTDISKVKNYARSLLDIVSLEPHANDLAPFLTVRNVSDAPILSISVTGRDSGEDLIDYGESVADQWGLAPNATYTIRLSTAEKFWRADQIRVLAAITVDGRVGGAAPILQKIIARWSGLATMNSTIYEISKGLATDSSIANLHATAAEIANLDEKALAKNTGNPVEDFGYLSGLHDAKYGMLNRLQHMAELPEAARSKMAAEVPALYSAKVQRLKQSISATERKPQ